MLQTQVIRAVPVFPDQEIHLRRRSLEGVPDMFDLALYNVQGGGYSLAVPFPTDAEMLGALIEALVEAREQM